MNDDQKSEVEAAIATIRARFPGWEPTPSMLGFARAVGKNVRPVRDEALELGFEFLRAHCSFYQGTTDVGACSSPSMAEWQDFAARLGAINYEAARPARSDDEVVRVAKVISEHTFAIISPNDGSDCGEWEDMSETARNVYLNAARAAIAAMNPKPAEAEAVDCPRCGGCGEHDASGVNCMVCEGRGVVPATPATQKAVEVRVLPGANSHCFDLRLVIGGPGDASKVGDGGECIAFADEPWASRIAAALAHPPAADVAAMREAARNVIEACEKEFGNVIGEPDHHYPKGLQYLKCGHLNALHAALAALPEEPSA